MQRALISTLLSTFAFALVLGSLGACAEPACHGDCGDDHGDETGPLETGDTGSSSAAADYCGCMLVNCHVGYHELWGEDHVESEAACLDVANALPEAGMDVDAGNFIECRLHYCELAESTDMADDPDNCPQAFGDTVCM
jgi:hypothetical protein